MTFTFDNMGEFQTYLKPMIQEAARHGAPEREISCKIANLEAVITLQGTVDTKQTLRYAELDGKIRITPNDQNLINAITELVPIRTCIHFENGIKIGESQVLMLEIKVYSTLVEMNRARAAQREFAESKMNRQDACLIL